MKIDTARINKAISLLENIRDDLLPPRSEEAPSDELGQDMEEIATEFMHATGMIVGVIMDEVLEETPEAEARTTFYNRLWDCFRRMMAEQGNEETLLDSFMDRVMQQQKWIN